MLYGAHVLNEVVRHVQRREVWQILQLLSLYCVWFGLFWGGKVNVHVCILYMYDPQQATVLPHGMINERIKGDKPDLELGNLIVV